MNFSEIHFTPKTMEEWAKENIETSFIPLGSESELAKRFPLRPVTTEDLEFTDEIEDDRVNCTVELADYDWMSYRYDCRIPCKTLGTLAVKHEYFGANFSEMSVKQFLPARLTGGKANFVVFKKYEYSSEIFIKYMMEDLKGRIRNEESDHYAYSMEDLLLDWFSCVIEHGKEQKTKPDEFQESFRWESVRIPKNTEEKRKRMPIEIILN